MHMDAGDGSSDTLGSTAEAGAGDGLSDPIGDMANAAGMIV